MHAIVHEHCNHLDLQTSSVEGSSSRLGLSWQRRWRSLRQSVLPTRVRVLRAARRRRPVRLGTPSEPWESLQDRSRLLDCLEHFEGLCVQLCCRSDRVLEEADRLASLDRDHAVRVEFRFDGGRLVRQGADSPYAERLRHAVAMLAGYGLEVRVVVEDLPRGAGPAARILEDLGARMATAGASDLRLAGGVADSWQRRVEPLRLALGFG